MPHASAVTPEKFATFGELLRFLRRRAGLTQRELSITVGYSESQISRLEQNERAPDEATLAARFVPALHIEAESQWVTRLLELGAATRSHVSEADAPQPAAEAKPTPHNLPIQLTSFIGREKELAEIKQLLGGRDAPVGRLPLGRLPLGGDVPSERLYPRLVTLTGHGGCGKTRLVLQAAAGLLEFFPEGVWLIELAPLADPAFVPQTVAAVLGLKEEPGRPILTTLIDHLRGKTALLILDNCEHLVQASAQLAEALLHACPDVRLLATSREMLGVAGERAVYVSSLSIPDPRQSPSPDLLPQYEAIQLFTDRAAIVMPDFTLTHDNAPAVAQICQRLDGIPLALELAAARVKVLRVEQIAARLTDAFRLLTGGSRTALPRHQTLQATMDWSYDLLSEAERRLFIRLSVFAGGWTLEAAEAVCADAVGADVGADPWVGPGTDTQVSPDEILDVLAQLVNKSLVLAERAQGEETRYRMLETVRQYALAKLAASGEADAVRRRHAEYYLALAEADITYPRRSAQPAWLERMEAEHDNLRAALMWCQATEGSAELGLRLTELMGLLCFHHGYWNEWRGWLEGALAHADAEGVGSSRVRALVVEDMGNALAFQGDYATSETWFAHSLRIFQELGDRSMVAYLHERLGWVARERGDAAIARARLEESLALHRELGDQLGVLWSAITLGESLVMQKEVALATARLEEGLALARQRGEAYYWVGWALNHLGHVAQIQGEYERATRLHEESLTVFLEFGAQNVGIAWAHQSLGETALAEDDVALAATHLAEALELFHGLGDRMGVSWCLAGLAGVAALDENPERAAWLWAAAEALRQSIGAREAPAAHETHERLKAAVRAQLDQATFNANWAEGQAVSVEQAVAEALQHGESR